MWPLNRKARRAPSGATNRSSDAKWGKEMSGRPTWPLNRKARRAEVVSKNSIFKAKYGQENAREPDVAA